MLRRREDALSRGTAIAGLAASVVLVCAALLAGPTFLSSRDPALVSGPDAAFSHPLSASAALPAKTAGR